VQLNGLIQPAARCVAVSSSREWALRSKKGGQVGEGEKPNHVAKQLGTCHLETTAPHFDGKGEKGKRRKGARVGGSARSLLLSAPSSLPNCLER